MSEEINKIFEQWKQFLSWCYENNDKTTEIHRDNLERVMTYTRQLENIIKEVRKKLIKSKEYQAVKSLGFNSKMSVLIELEEILDKEVN